jgi:putative sterol carrier protein
MKTLSIAFSLLLIGGLIAGPIQAQVDPATTEEAAPEMVANEPSAEVGETEEMDGTEAMEGAQDEEAEEAGPVVLMDSAWAKLACAAWNEDPTLTDELAAPGWVANNKDRGYKVLQVYRTDCETSPWVELHIADQDGKALCVYGGPIKTDELISGVDYIMHAQTQRWKEMGSGAYGPMKGMMTGRLKFKGPKWEAMRNMGPFTSFLRLAGAVPSEADVCPEEDSA